ncbi:MAG: alpha/beta fold hydrolase, partial [Candidatus Sulfotelmatobacter sp.]
MSTYVLVHGAWHGSWCWKRVRKALQAQGHEVFTPTLTGIGERSHLLSLQVNLDTHIDDVVNLIRWEELSNVVLCGHSYGGAVVSGVADRIPERIGALVYLDAFLLEADQSVHDEVPPEQKNMQLEGARVHGEGWKVPPIPAGVFKVNAKDVAWVDSQCTM